MVIIFIVILLFVIVLCAVLEVKNRRTERNIIPNKEESNTLKKLAILGGVGYVAKTAYDEVKPQSSDI